MKKMILLLSLLTMSVLHANAQEATYRPVVEKGKMWKVGWIPSGSEDNVAQAIAYYWLEDEVDSLTRAYIDRIFDYRYCLKLMKEYVCNEEYKDIFPAGPQDCNYLIENVTRRVINGYVTKNPGSVQYDIQGQLVCCFDVMDAFEYPIGKRFYTCWINDVSRGTYVNGFKGLLSTIVASNWLYTATFVFEDDGETPEQLYEFETVWMEGVGSVYGPLTPLIDPTRQPIEWYLMECRVGDDLLYYNPDIIDGVNPPDDETKKRIDFTHIQKPRPKTPRRAEAADEIQFSGAFTQTLLDLELGTMSDTYHVTITDERGETVYDKTVCAIDVLALNIDISEWQDATYTITVENDDESYVGTFSPSDPTAIVEHASERAVTLGSVTCYDLSGRRLDHEPEHGLYIKDGRKYLKK